MQNFLIEEQIIQTIETTAHIDHSCQKRQWLKCIKSAEDGGGQTQVALSSSIDKSMMKTHWSDTAYNTNQIRGQNQHS